MATKDLLIVDDDSLVCESLKEMLLMEGFTVDAVLSGQAALENLRGVKYSLILSDIQMPGLDGFELLKELKGRAPDTLVIFITGHGHIAGAVEAIKLGAYDYITKPIDDLRLKLTIGHALEQKKLQASYNTLKQRLKPWALDETLVFGDRKMDRLLEMVHTIADTMATVLITGESGTGKSMLARYIHDHSHRREGPFVKISCGSLSETLLESELFGHVRGSFTGAIRDKKGKFEEANGGTIFLDDINSASANLQVKLLRVLQEKVIERVGGNVPYQTDVRIITATNTSLQDEVAKQNFREDLYYRINVVSFTIPPLRDRLSDIEPLALHFIKHFNQIHHKEIKGISKSTLQICLQYPWPGNVRELENVIERAVILSPGEFIVPESLPGNIRESKPATPREALKHLKLEEALALAEREILINALESFSWNRQLSARSLGISRTTLFNKMRRFQLVDPRRPAPEGFAGPTSA
ncbi:MAG: sigma-54 dependent transcriptional regulator [Syntrophobacterales bacterium]|jgi:DNA-binding NtrC family response regulator|nr:sigma-54 dependent transcriptional regulator [Syntrophobacterales bacterium]